MIIFTMGKVGTMTLVYSLRISGALFVDANHNFRSLPQSFPFTSTREIWRERAMMVTRLFYIPWLNRLPRLRYITAVREPIGRLLSLYFYTYQFRFGRKVKDTPLQTLLDDFPRIFEQDYTHPLVPGYFFETEFKSHLGIDIYEHPSPQREGTVTINHGKCSVLVMKLEISDQQKSTALSSWLGQTIPICRLNTAEESGYVELYEKFKKRVRIPHRYAEAIYQSSYMKHFYAPEERAKFWQRWEPQLDRSITLPDWVENQLNAYHPPITSD